MTSQAAERTPMPLNQYSLATVSSERWIDDIGDITYVRCGKARISFPVVEEYSGDNCVSRVVRND
jgi:hypothetical protein